MHCAWPWIPGVFGYPDRRSPPVCCVTDVTDDRKFDGGAAFEVFGETECVSRGIRSFARRPWPPFLSWPSWSRVLLLRSPGGDYTVKARFQNAAQLVKGNLVQIGGAPVGKVDEHRPHRRRPGRGHAEASTRPTRRCAAARWPRSARRRCPASPTATSTCAWRPSSAEKIPDGGVIEQDATTTAVDLDQLFNTFDPETRKALQGVIDGSANQIKGQGKAFNEGIAYLNPSLAASSRLFRELNRDTPLLERFIVSSSQLVTDIADRRDDLAGLVDDLATTTTAIGNQKEALARVDRPPARLPAPRQHDVRQPARRARRPRPARRGLQAGGEEAAPVPRRAAPARPRRAPDDQRPLADRQAAGRRQRPDRADEPAGAAARRHHAQVRRQRQAARRARSRPRQDALKGDTPEFAFFRPYTPDLLGWFDDFSHSGTYDALGAASRVGIHANPFALTGATGAGQYELIPPQLRDEALAGDARAAPEQPLPGRAASTRPPTAPAPTSRPPTTPATRRRCCRAAEMRRVLARHPRPRRRGRLRAHRRRGAKEEQRPRVHGRVRQRVRARQGRRREGRRRARGDDLRRCGSTSKSHARARRLRAHQAAASARCAPTSTASRARSR